MSVNFEIRKEKQGFFLFNTLTNRCIGRKFYKGYNPYTTHYYHGFSSGYKKMVIDICLNDGIYYKNKKLTVEEVSKKLLDN